MTEPADANELSLVDLAALVGDVAEAPHAADEAIALIRRADELRRRSHDHLHLLVASARSHGVSWQSIGDALGVSRQAAFKRFGGDARISDEGDAMPSQTIDLMDRTHGVFRHLDSGDYEAVRANMTYTCARALSKRTLRDVWSQVVDDTGRLEACVDTTVQTPDGSTTLGKLANRYLSSGAIVQTTLQHEAGEWIGRVAYNGAGKITGILIAPPGSQDLPF